MSTRCTRRVQLSFNTFENTPHITVVPRMNRARCVHFLQVPLSPSQSAAASTPPAELHPSEIPSNMAKPKPRRQCDCGICKGKTVASSTWYLHNPGGSKVRYVLPQETIDIILRQPDTNVLSRARKRHLDEDLEDIEVPISKRATGSSSVCIASDHNICASSGGYLQQYTSRPFVPAWKMVTDVRRTQK